MDGHGISLSRTVWNKALLHPCVPYYPLRAMEHHFVVPNVQILSRFPLSSQVLPCLFGGDAKSLAWVFLARRVLPFVFFLPFLGAMPNPSLGCFLLVRCCLSCLGSFVAFFGGDAKSLAWVFLARRVLTKWMVMGSVYLELFETKPCCILVCPIIPYVLWNTIL